MVTVLPLVGEKFHVAKKWVDDNHLNMTQIDRDIIVTELAGTVKKTIPKANMEVTDGKVIIEAFKVILQDLASLVGKNYNDAYKFIDDSQLKMIKVDAEIIDSTWAGTVKKQAAPKPSNNEEQWSNGDHVPVDTSVVIEVFKAIVPYVVNSGLEKAKTDIWNAGLTADINYLDPLEEGKNYSVVSQSMQAGNKVSAGTVLRIDAKVKERERVGIGRIKEPRLIERESPFPFPPCDPLKNPGEEIRINPGLKSQLDIDKVKMTGKNKIIR